MSETVSMNIRMDDGSRTVREDIEEARKQRAEGLPGVDADELAAQMDAILARADTKSL